MRLEFTDPTASHGWPPRSSWSTATSPTLATDAPRYHRRESPTQTAHDARLQIERGEIWGASARWSDIPKVKAYAGRLPDGASGIEFTTDVAPDAGCPPGHAYWSGPRAGVEVVDGRARIRIRILKSTCGNG